jgi:hypothetical protein
MTSPIERMVDEACGVSVRPVFKGTLEHEKRALIAVADAAKSWWISLAEHGLEEPMRMAVERNLSESVEELVRLGW